MSQLRMAAVIVATLLAFPAGAQGGMTPVYPSQLTARSAIVPEPTRWWLRPVSSAARVGEQIDVVLNVL